MLYFNATKGITVNIKRIWLYVLVIIKFIIDYYCNVQCKTHVQPIPNPSAVFVFWYQIMDC
jgi:hypothetical protein